MAGMRFSTAHMFVAFMLASLQVGWGGWVGGGLECVRVGVVAGGVGWVGGGGA